MVLMKENKARWISRILTLYHFFSRRLKKDCIPDASMEFQRIAIYSTTALGDLMFNTPAILALKQRYPQASFTLVSSEKNRPLVAGSSWFDNIFYWDNKIRNAHRLIRALRRFKPQLTVILHSYMPYDVLCAVLSGSEVIVRDNYRVDSPLLNRWLNAYSLPFDGHLIQRKLNLLTVLGCRNDDPAMRIPVAYKPGQKAAKKRIGFQMGASEAQRCWPVMRFVELAALLDAAQYRVVLIGGPKDLPLVTQFKQLAGDDLVSRVEINVGKTSLVQLLTVIDGLDVLVTGDTGPLHLAVALQTSTVSLYASAEPAHTGPYQDLEQHVTLKVDGTLTDVSQPLQQISARAIYEQVALLILG